MSSIGKADRVPEPTEKLLFFNYGCCVPTWEFFWMSIILFIFLTSTCIFCCVIGGIMRWMYKRRVRKRVEAVRLRFREEDELKRRIDDRLRITAEKMKQTSPDKDTVKSAPPQQITYVYPPALMPNMQARPGMTVMPPEQPMQAQLSQRSCHTATPSTVPSKTATSPQLPGDIPPTTSQATSTVKTETQGSSTLHEAYIVAPKQVAATVHQMAKHGFPKSKPVPFEPVELTTDEEQATVTTARSSSLITTVYSDTTNVPTPKIRSTEELAKEVDKRLRNLVATTPTDRSAEPTKEKSGKNKKKIPSPNSSTLSDQKKTNGKKMNDVTKTAKLYKPGREKKHKSRRNRSKSPSPDRREQHKRSSSLGTSEQGTITSTGFSRGRGGYAIMDDRFSEESPYWKNSNMSAMKYPDPPREDMVEMQYPHAGAYGNDDGKPHYYADSSASYGEKPQPRRTHFANDVDSQERSQDSSPPLKNSLYAPSVPMNVYDMREQDDTQRHEMTQKTNALLASRRSRYSPDNHPDRSRHGGGQRGNIVDRLRSIVRTPQGRRSRSASPAMERGHEEEILGSTRARPHPFAYI